MSKCEYLTRNAYLLATTTRTTSSSRENNDISDVSNPTLPSASDPSTISWHQAALNSHLGKWSELNRVEVFSSAPHNSSSWGKAGDLLRKKTFDDVFHLELQAEESWSSSLSKVPCCLPCQGTTPSSTFYWSWRPSSPRPLPGLPDLCLLYFCWHLAGGVSRADNEIGSCCSKFATFFEVVCSVPTFYIFQIFPRKIK